MPNSIGRPRSPGGMIEQIGSKGVQQPRLYNLNIPTAAVHSERPAVQVVPMGLVRGDDKYEKRIDPRGRNYYWATGELGLANPAMGKHETDLTRLKAGHITLTPLHFDLTAHAALAEMESWKWELGR